MSHSGTPSGRFLLRLPPALHAQLAASARDRGVSLNEHCVRSLAAGEGGVPGLFTAPVAKALMQLGPELVGVAVFGSFARGEAGSESDVDILIVVAPGVAIVRSLYADWDETDLHVEGRRVEPHFVHMRPPDEPISGFWAEMALDAAVVHDPKLILARELSRIRRSLAEGALVRRESGGLGWWSAG